MPSQRDLISTPFRGRLFVALSDSIGTIVSVPAEEERNRKTLKIEKESIKDHEPEKRKLIPQITDQQHRRR